ncbi:MAG: MBL fold metallo-hydrolase [Pseudomonadota bacterium]
MLRPDAFAPKRRAPALPSHAFHSMRVRFWGVRGSLPVPGSKTERYGGNTSCVEIRSAAGTRIIIDAGTGIRRLGKELMREEFESGQGSAHLLISHTHWDHIQGLPFFSPLYKKGNHLYVYARRRDDVHLRAVFASQTDDPYFPTSIEEAKAGISFRELADSAKFEIAEVDVTCARLNHPYIATAYRLSVDGAAVTYVSDTAPFSDILFENEYVPQPPARPSTLPEADRVRLQAMRDGVVRLCEGADLVIYDTMFTADDYLRIPHYGHSRPSDALDVCREAGARRLALFHHAPERSDAEVDSILEATRGEARAAAIKLDISAAYEGLDIELGAGAPADPKGGT